jgi:probable LLM family oxidoreductase
LQVGIETGPALGIGSTLTLDTGSWAPHLGSRGPHVLDATKLVVCTTTCYSGCHMELGLATFADLSSGISPEQRMRDLIEEAVLADQLGLDVFAIGEHHRPDFLISSPAVALAAVAAKTERIRLSSAVTVLSSDDPVRVFQQFAELDLISGGRAEIMAGRGSFIESFPLFGYDLDDYDELYAEKLDLLLKIRASTSVDWSGRLRAPLHGAGVWPRPVQDPLPVWVAVGGSPQSVVRAGTLGLPMTLAIIGGQPERFAPLVALYRRAAAEAGHDADALPLAINTHAFVGETSAAADSAFAAPYLAMMNRIGRERGWPPSGRAEYEALRSPQGAVAAGSPEQVAEKILFEHELFHNSRYVAQMSVGAVKHADVLRSMELFGTEVAPVVRAEVARRTATPAVA